MNRNLSGRVVVITGAAHGIGAQVARELTGRGARVAILDRDRQAAQRLVGELGGGAAAFKADVTCPESVKAAFGSATKHFGAVDVVVANAGIAGPGSTVAAVDPVEWRQVIDVNLVGVFHTIQAALPYVKQRRGYVMVVASVGAVIPGPLLSGYVASKAGVESLVRSLRIELAADGVDVGIAYFGLIGTGLAEQALTRSGWGAVMAALPATVGKPAPVEAAAAAVTAGIVRRARRVYAPWWVPLLLDLRPLVFLVDRLLAVLPRMRRMVREADRAGVDA